MALLTLEQVRGEILNPSLYAQNLDFHREAVLFLRVERATYQSASFLDDRILTPQAQGRWVSFDELAPWLSGAKPAHPVHFIFHSGHVGSTLVSRLIEEAGGILSLREPLPLRMLAAAFDERSAPHALIAPDQLDELLNWHLALWARGYEDTTAVIVKATSSAGRICPKILHACAGARAVYLNLGAEPYLATLLAGQNSHLDLRGMAPERFKRMSALALPSPTPLHAMSLGEIAALTWAAEKLTQIRAQDEFGARILPINFDGLLGAPEDAARRIFAHLHLKAREGFFEHVPKSDVFKRYSKAPDRAYTPELRLQILAESRVRNAAEISKGLKWLERAASQSPAIARALA